MNKSNYVSPNYDLSNKELYIKLYFSPERELCIIGELDNNYIFWCSITKLEDQELNMEIFDFITNHTFESFSNEYIVLGNERYQHVKNWYSCALRKSDLPNMYWETPFGHYYGYDKENHGRYFSRDVKGFYQDLINKCEYRNYENRYIEVLKNYVDVLTREKEYQYYYKMKPLISILESESYLKLTQNHKLRETYLSCMEECNRLYNRYMTAVR